MTPFPDTSYGCFPSTYISANSVKALCMVSLRAQVDSSNVTRLAPISPETYNYAFPGPSPGASNAMPCKYLNASGLFDSMPSQRTCELTCTWPRAFAERQQSVRLLCRT
jgi:hypothetical protein